MFIEDEAHVNNIAVDPSWQGRGIATVLMLDLARRPSTGDHGISPSRSGWATSPALALYRRFGMAPVGLRPNYYPEPARMHW